MADSKLRDLSTDFAVKDIKMCDGMLKKALIFFVTFGLCLSLISCSIAIQGDGKIAYVTVDDCEERVLSYNGNLYYPTSAPYLHLWTTPEDVELGWHSNLPFSNRIGYYSYESDCPLYVWTSRSVDDYASEIYMLKDFPYKEQKYVLAGTDVEIYFFNEIKRPDYDVPIEKWVNNSDNMTLYLVADDRITDDFNRLSINQCIVLADDGNYYIFNNGPWILSDNLVKILKENGVISK